MSSLRSNPLILITLLILGGLLFLGSRALQSLAPFPVHEFVDLSGPVASEKMRSWDFSIDSASVDRVSMKWASTIDSHSTFAKIELSEANAGILSAERHAKMAEIGDSLSRKFDCEQDRRAITTIPVRCPSCDAPEWWWPPSGAGNATENMLWYPDATYGVAQGCYTLYDESKQVLWVYEYSAQHDKHWERGTRPAFPKLADLISGD